MPFTVSHAAVVLPFTRLLARWRLLSAAVIGAMVPDFGLFIPWQIPRNDTHSFNALFTFCLPLGLATYWLFQYVVKTPVLELLPNAAYARWRPVASPADVRSVRQWLLAACGVFGGAVSHLVLDAFSHEGARGVRMLPMLDEQFMGYGGHNLRGVRLVQDGTSLFGLAIIFCLVWYALRAGSGPVVEKRALPAPERHAWVWAYAVTAIALTAAWAVGEHYFRGSWRYSPTGIVAIVAIASLRGVATALLGVSIVLGMRLRARR